MAAALNPNTLSGVARALVQSNRLTVADAQALVTDAKSAGVSFIEQLVASKRMTAREVAQFCSEIFGFPLLDLSAYDPQLVLSDAIDRKLVQQHRVVALAKRGNRLSVAISDPTNTAALDQIKFQTSLMIDPVVVEDDKLGAIVGGMAEAAGASLLEVPDEDLNLEFTDDEALAKAEEASMPDVDDAPVVRFLQRCSWTRFVTARRTCISSLTRRLTGSASGSMESCVRSPIRRLPSRKSSRRASR